MSTTLTAEPLPDAAAVLLTVLGAPDGPLAIMRTDSNGTRPVRLLPAQEPIGGSLVVRDYEAALTGPVSYAVAGERTNLMTDPSGETSLGPWASAGARLTGTTRADVTAVDGAKVTRWTANQVVGSSGGYLTWFRPGGAQPGDVMVASVYARAGLAANYLLRHQWRDAANVSLLQTNGDQLALAAGGPFTRFTVQPPPAPPGATQSLLLFYCLSSMAVGDWYELDASLAEDGTEVLPYVAGTVPWTFSTTAALDVELAVLSVPVRPALRVDQGVVTGYSESSSSGAIVHEVPARESPIVIRGRLRKRTGSTVLRVPTMADVAAVRQLVREGEAVLLRVPGYPGMDWYGNVERVDAAPAEVDGRVAEWEVTLPFTEEDAPEAPMLGAADWTISDAAAQAATIDELAAQFATIRQLSVGP